VIYLTTHGSRPIHSLDNLMKNDSFIYYDDRDQPEW